MGTLFKPLIWRLGNLTITPLGVGFFLAVITYLFMVWQQFRKDFDEDSVVRFSLTTLLAFLFGGKIMAGIFPFYNWKANISSLIDFWRHSGFSFLGGVALMMLIIIIFSHRRKWTSEYFLEGVTRPILTGAAIITLGLFLTTAKGIYLIHFVFLLCVFLLTKLMSGYRSFPWYPSGKPGFLFLIALIAFSLLEGGLDFYLASQLYWRSIVAWGISGGAALALYFLAKNR